MKTNGTFKIIALMIFAASVTLRIVSLPHGNNDTNAYLTWYNYFSERGLSAFANSSLGYTPPYLYLLWVATLMKEVIPPWLAIKLIPTLFDGLSAFAVYKIIRLKYPQGDMPYLATAGFLLLPTVVVNSSYWGQVDSLYLSFILVCLYFLLTDRPLYAMLMFGIAVSIKAQAVLIAPFLLVMMFKKRIPWSYFLLPPVVYLIMILPAVLAGMPIFNASTMYLSQANTFNVPSMDAPNLYSLIIYPPYYVDWDTAIRIGFVIAAVSIISWTVVYAGRRYKLNNQVLILSMLTSAALVPFVLPKMHDRYFYPADVLSFIFAFYYPAYWFMPLLFQGASGIMYYVFLSSVDPSRFHILFPISAGLCTLALLTLLAKQYRETTNSPED